MRSIGQTFGQKASFIECWSHAGVFWRHGDNQDTAPTHSHLGPGQDIADATMCWVPVSGG